jgi:hypothetical protein
LLFSSHRKLEFKFKLDHNLMMIFIHTLGMRERWTSSPPLLNCWCCLGFFFRVFFFF